jgi:hypothetical protein
MQSMRTTAVPPREIRSEGGGGDIEGTDGAGDVKRMQEKNT